MVDCGFLILNLGSSARLCLAGFDEAKQNPQLSFRPLFPKRNSGLFAEEAISFAECMLIGVCSQPRILSPPFSTGFHFLFFPRPEVSFARIPRRGMRATLHLRLIILSPSGLHIWLAHGERGISILSRWRVVKSTPVALVKLRGGAVKSSPWRAWLNHFAAQSGEGE